MSRVMNFAPRSEITLLSNMFVVRRSVVVVRILQLYGLFILSVYCDTSSVFLCFLIMVIVDYSPVGDVFASITGQFVLHCTSMVLVGYSGDTLPIIPWARHPTLLPNDVS